MACTGRYAEAYDFAMMFGCDAIYVGFDDSGGAANAFVTDSTRDFTSRGDFDPLPLVGWAIYNATERTYGKITTVAAHVLGTTNTWSDGDEYRILVMTLQQVATAETFLDIAAADIHDARMAANGCDCTLSDAGAAYARKLNVIDAAILHKCPCVNTELTDDMRRAYLLWIQDQLQAIANGDRELCQGATGALFPAVGQIERQLDEWSEVVVRDNAFLRDN